MFVNNTYKTNLGSETEVGIPTGAVRRLPLRRRRCETKSRLGEPLLRSRSLVTREKGLPSFDSDSESQAQAESPTT
eukprot:2434808-Rhodomonas_salina.1